MTEFLWWMVAAFAVVVLFSLRLRKGERLFNSNQRRDTMRRWGDKCAYRWPVTWHRCRGGIEFDHQIPYSRGGRTVVGNSQPLCRAINRQKGARYNGWFVLRYGWVVGSLVYLVRWIKAEGMKR